MSSLMRQRPRPVSPPSASSRGRRRAAIAPRLALAAAMWALSCSSGERDPGARPAGPLGGAAVLDLRRLPTLSEGVTSRQVSSYDRTGCNMDFGSGLPYGLSQLDPELIPGLELPGLAPACRTAESFAADNSVLYEADGRQVIADVTGPGLLTRVWLTAFETQASTSPDAVLGDLLISVDDAPGEVMPMSELFRGEREDAPFPLVAGPDRSAGGHVSYVSIPFERRLRISSDRPLAYYHVGYYQMAPEVWRQRFGGPAARDAALPATVARALADPASHRPVGDQHASAEQAALAPGRSAAALSLSTRAPARVLALEGRFAAPLSAGLWRDVWLRATFDDAREPAFEAPLGFVFGAPEGGAMRSWPVESVASDGRQRVALHLPMPFSDTARFELDNRGGETLPAAAWTASFEALEPEAAPWGYLRAQYRSASRDATDPRDVVLLEAGGRGHVVGTVLVMGCAGACAYLTAPRFGHLEGDERIVIDGARSPALHGTGAEDYFNSAWYFLGGPYGLPLHGHTAIGEAADALGVVDRVAAYRWHLTDPIVFQHDVRFSVEHGPTSNAPVRFDSLVWFYARPEPAWDAACDALDLARPDDRSAHAYAADGDVVVQLASAFPGTPPTDPLSYEVHRARGPQRFTLAIPRANTGVRLRRLYDAGEGGQRARVRIDGELVGTWAESDFNPHQRWAESDFEIDSTWTSGRAALHVTIEPSGPVDWTAVRYEAFAYGAAER